MKNLVLSLFLIFSFAVQGFGSDIELSKQKSGECLKKIVFNSDDECFRELSLNCVGGNDCSDCLAYISISITLMSVDPDGKNIYEEAINKILDYKSDTCPNLIRDTDRIINENK